MDHVLSTSETRVILVWNISNEFRILVSILGDGYLSMIGLIYSAFSSKSGCEGMWFSLSVLEGFMYLLLLFTVLHTHITNV